MEYIGFTKEELKTLVKAGAIPDPTLEQKQKQEQKLKQKQTNMVNFRKLIFKK